MDHKNTQAVEDYLKTIYAMTLSGERASTNGIAERLGVAPASATGMIQKLAIMQPPLVEYEKHYGAALTSAGKIAALEIVRHHRLLETFLFEKLGYSWDEVHVEADRLEHVISEDMEERIARILGDPRIDPHGEPIPDREFQIPDELDISLEDLCLGDQAIIERIRDGEPGLLRYLTSIGLTLHCHIKVLDVIPFDRNIQLQIEGQDEPKVLGPRVAHKIYVSRV
ncbi:MAG: putative DtxR family transcriptional regulator [Chloroflexi bacterium]|nr:putative DtxR family transcriptional regulator [Chloroflexota bacterium]